MSTRSIIAVYTDQPAGKWRGTYHHSDGYPSGVGKSLWDIYHKYYPGFLSAMLEFIIDAHPEGWSTLVGTDFSQRPTWSEPDERYRMYQENIPMPPQAYKYRGETPSILDETSDSWQEWAYVFDVQANSMTILERLGFGSDVRYAHKATIPLDGMEPDWESFEK